MAEQDTQTWGPVTDYFGKGPWAWAETNLGRRRVRLALCVCEHGKEWPEGDLGESAGGKACEECSVASLKAFHESLAKAEQ